MIIKKDDNLEIDSVGNIESIEANISADSLPFIFNLLTEGFYSNRIGSIVREITSNCFDAHKEINSDEAVIIRKDYDSENNVWFIKFIDKGIGLSRERLVNIYMNYFSSTKRTSNDFIGGFGIGSKSPLSYQDMFYITSVHNGKKYECILSKGKKHPELDCLNGLETVEIYEDKDGNPIEPILVKYPIGIDTNESNGTEIKIEIKDGDFIKFNSELKSQLCYFDNVYFERCDIDNDYKIIEGNTFKYRSKNSYSDEMHIVYGKVSYPIDWKQLKVKSSDEVQIAVGVKFEIGELQVTPNRETIIYNDASIELINNRIKDCVKELVDIYNKQNPEITDLFDYLNKRNERPHINFQDICKLYIPKKHGVENSLKYAPLKDITIPDNPFFDYNIELIDGEKIGKNYNNIISTIKNSTKLYYLYGTTNKYTNAFIATGVLITNIKSDYKEYCKQLGLYHYKQRKYSYENKHDTYVDLDGRTVRRVPILGKAKLIKAYKEHIHQLILSKCQIYDNIIVTEEWIKEYKKENRESSAAYLRKLQAKVVVKINGWRSEVTIKYLSEYHTLVYSYLGDNNIHNLKKVVLSRKSFQTVSKNVKVKGKIVNKVWDKKILFIEVAKTNEKYIKDLPNAVYIDNVYTHKKFQRLFRDINTARIISSKPYMYSGIFDITSFLYTTSKYYYYKLTILRSFKNNNEYEGHINSKLQETINNAGINPEMELITNELDKVYEQFSKIELLKYINNNIPDNLLTEIIKDKKILKLNQNFYSSREPMKLILPIQEPFIIEENMFETYIEMVSLFRENIDDIYTSFQELPIELLQEAS